MSVRKIKNHGKWVWQARVAYRGRGKAAFRDSKESAREAEATLLGELKGQAAESEEEGQRPATLRQLFEFYVDDLVARGKGPETIATASGTAHVVELLMPELLDKPVTKINEADVFAFRRARVERSTTAARLRAQAATRRAEKAAQAAQRAETKPSDGRADLAEELVQVLGLGRRGEDR